MPLLSCENLERLSSNVVLKQCHAGLNFLLLSAILDLWLQEARVGLGVVTKALSFSDCELI